MARQTRWFVLAVCSLTVFALLALTAIDKYDERSCQDRERASRSLFRSDCDGFLPW